MMGCGIGLADLANHIALKSYFRARIYQSNEIYIPRVARKHLAFASNMSLVVAVAAARTYPFLCETFRLTTADEQLLVVSSARAEQIDKSCSHS